jgi:hypothetical protein
LVLTLGKDPFELGVVILELIWVEKGVCRASLSQGLIRLLNLEELYLNEGLVLNDLLESEVSLFGLVFR